MKRISFNSFSVIILLLTGSILLFVCLSCEQTDTALAPYAGSRLLSEITIEEGSFRPKLTWLGGYVSVFGVNRGETAALDSTLVWLVNAPDNGLHYPLEFGQTPDGASDITNVYGGTSATELVEDSSYTFWVMKNEAWQQIENAQGKQLFVDSTSGSSSVTIIGDRIYIGSMVHTQEFRNLDVYINLDNIRSVGKLATIFVEQPRVSNNPLISWKIKQNDVPDSLISALGIVEGQSYNPQKLVWEVFSVDSSGGNPVYGKNNIIISPLVAGQIFPSTYAFIQYPPQGLERDKDYYLWIANKDWDGEGRLRVTDYYAYVTFHTW